MGLLKTTALAGALLAATATGGAPAARAQSATVIAPRAEARAMQFMSGAGSEIGVAVRDLDGQNAKGVTSGALVAEVVPKSPAETAGIKSGDVIVEFDGERVRSARQLTRLVQETPAGRKVQASLLRDGQKVSISVEPREGSGYAYRLLGDLANSRVFEDLGEEIRRSMPRHPAPPAPPAAPGAKPTPPVPPTPRAMPDLETFIWRTGTALGLTTSELTSQLGEYFGTKQGVLVNSVASDSAAAKAGVKAGDVITAFNGAPVDSPAQLRREVQRLKDGEEFTIGLMRDRKSVTVKGKAESSRAGRTFRS